MVLSKIGINTDNPNAEIATLNILRGPCDIHLQADLHKDKFKPFITLKSLQKMFAVGKILQIPTTTMNTVKWG